VPIPRAQSRCRGPRHAQRSAPPWPPKRSGPSAQTPRAPTLPARLVCQPRSLQAADQHKHPARPGITPTWHESGLSSKSRQPRVGQRHTGSPISVMPRSASMSAGRSIHGHSISRHRLDFPSRITLGVKSRVGITQRLGNADLTRLSARRPTFMIHRFAVCRDALKTARSLPAYFARSLLLGDRTQN